MTERNKLEVGMGIVDQYRRITVAGKPYLIHRTSGDALIINNIGSFFIDLLFEGLDKSAVCARAADIFGVDTYQVSSDLDAFLDLLQQPHKESIGIYSQLSRQQKSAGSMTGPVENEAAYFRVGGIEFGIACDDPEIEALYFALFAPLSVTRSNRALIMIGIHECPDGWAISCEGQLFDEVPEIKYLIGRLRDLMVEQLTSISSFRLGLHAAAILSSDDQALVFPGSSGAGKSTLSAYLALMGRPYLGDDSLVIDLRSQRLIAFPAAAKLDQQSVEVLDLNMNPDSNPMWKPIEGNFESDEGLVQLVEFGGSSQLDDDYAIKALVFPKFDKRSKSRISRIESAETFSRLNDSGIYAYQTVSADTTEAYINCFAKFDAYELHYSHIEQARELLRSANLL